MPEVRTDSRTSPKRAQLAYVSVPPQPSPRTVARIRELLEAGKAVMAVAPVCSSIPGRAKVLSVLRAGGLTAAEGLQLGWATAAPDGEPLQAVVVTEKGPTDVPVTIKSAEELPAASAAPEPVEEDATVEVEVPPEAANETDEEPPEPKRKRRRRR